MKSARHFSKITEDAINEDIMNFEFHHYGTIQFFEDTIESAAQQGLRTCQCELQNISDAEAKMFKNILYKAGFRQDWISKEDNGHKYKITLYW